MAYLATYKDLYEEVARNVGLDPISAVDVTLSRKWTNAAYMEINNRKDWPWIMKRFAFRTNALQEDGTVAVTKDSRAVTGTGTAFASSDEGQVFIVASDVGDKYRILSVSNSTNLVLEHPFIDVAQSDLAYHIWTKYYTLASDAKQITYMRRVNNWPLRFKYKEDFEKNQRHAHFGQLSYWSLWGQDYAARSDSTGTVTGSVSTSAITGVGTAWLDKVQPGDKMTIASVDYHIKTVNSDTSITIYERLVAAASGATYAIVSEMAPTILLDGTPDPIEVVEYEYQHRTYPMLEDSEIPNLPQQFLDAVVIGGMKYGFEYMGNGRMTQQSAQFEAEMKKAALFWDVSFKPDRFVFGSEAYSRF